MGSPPNPVAPAHHGAGAHRIHRHHAHAVHQTQSFQKLVAHAAAPVRKPHVPLPQMPLPQMPAHQTSNALAPDAVTEALRTAMAREGVPPTWESSLHFIMDRESGGRVGVANQTDSARGLFQLTRASYGLNPNGTQSFGNAVEEAQGGIRYIRQRYQTAENAVQFWQRHRYY